MRSDMKDLLLDTGRSGGGWGNTVGRRARFKRTDPDDMPTKQTSSRRRIGSKDLGDRLNPLFKFLRRNCGRLWDDVYKEICEFADNRSIRGYHLREHVLNYVVPDCYFGGHRGRYGPFFVDSNGLLQVERRMTLKERRALYARHREKENPRLVADKDHWWEKIEGHWYWFETKHITYKNSYEDLVMEDGEVKIVRILMPDYTRHKTTKKQVNGKTQKELDKKYGQTKRY